MRFDKYAAAGAYHWRAVPHIARPWKLDVPAYSLYRTVVGQAEIKSRTGTWLDVGTGDGAIFGVAGKSRMRRVGIESEMAGIRLARAALGGKAHLVASQGAELPFPNTTVEAVTLVEVIEHVADDRSLCHELSRVLARDGVLVVSTPLRRPGGPLYDHRHVREYSAEELVALLENYFDHVKAFGAIAHSDFAKYRGTSLKARLRRSLIKASRGRLVTTFGAPREPTPNIARHIVAVCTDPRR